jgi:hypothetical protein
MDEVVRCLRTADGTHPVILGVYEVQLSPDFFATKVSGHYVEKRLCTRCHEVVSIKKNIHTALYHIVESGHG